MTRTIQELEDEIRQLSADDRRQLLRDLIADLDGGAELEIEKAWLEEVERRYQDLKDRSAETIPANEVFERVRKRLRDGN